MDEFLYQKWQQLKQILERLEDVDILRKQNREFAGELRALTMDVEKMERDAKHEYDTF